MSFINNGSGCVRAGLYGAGAFGGFILQALAPSKSVRATAIASRTPDHAARLARAHQIDRVHATFEQLIADPQLDLVMIATPPREHGPRTLAALNAGKNVFVEKPLATNVHETKEIIHLSTSRRLSVGVDYPMIYTPLVEAMMVFAKSRLAGPLLRISVENLASCDGLADDHWFWNEDISGGIFVEHGVHFFDWCGRVAGDPHRVVAFAAGGRPQRKDRVLALVEHHNGVLASHYHAFVAQSNTQRTRVVFSYESVDLILDGWIPTRLQLRGQGAAVATTTIRRMMSRAVASIPNSAGFVFDAGDSQELYLQGVRAAAEDLARSILEPGYVARNDIQRTLLSLQVAVAAREAAKQGVAVSLLQPETAPLP